MLKLAMVGFGAIGQELARMLQADPHAQLSQVVVRAPAVETAARLVAVLAPQARVLTAIDPSPAQRPDLLLECAGHSAVAAHVVPALRAGIPCVVASIGALGDAALLARLEDEATRGGTRLQLVAGGIGAIDALDAARWGGLDRVVYVGRKPPRSWQGTPAEQVCVLSDLRAPCVVFRGSARDAASSFPKNANVAATIALAGLGLDRTEVELIADPGVERNVHRLEASGAFGRLELQIENLPLPTNPKTSALTVFSLARAVRNATARVFY